ncbi:SMI1/KNR4 family protein [Streptomyces sp. NPDC091371]|uniref:SMI1/KNR4 family protein n=1 Tax=Streptomyces sp. NPDC091371 TaxID=3155303 RepID=UPI003439FAB7
MTDDLIDIDVQTPKRRITDPAEALAALERAVPGLADHRRPAPAPLDWALVEESLGTTLPSDYKHLAERYASFVIGDYFHVGLPEPGGEQLWLRGLLPWADSHNGDQSVWSTAGETPQQWFVTVAGRGGAWWHYEGGAVQFLAELCDGTVEPWGLCLFDPEVTPC